MDEGKKLPLHDEAEARREWRRDEDPLPQDGNTGVPASEADDARMARDEESDGRPGKGGPGTIPPPD